MQSVRLVVPGRKTDMSDAAWLCQLAEAGLLRASFVPPKPIRDLRQLTRYRKTQIAERQREAQRPHKALEDTNIKLDCVASDLLGKSGRAMLDALVSGTTDPEILAELAKGRLRQKIPALREALEGRFNSLHALLIGAILAHLDFLDEQIDRLSDAIEEHVAPFEAAVELLRTIPGVQRRTAEVISAEIGADMTVFPTARHLASWAGQCPGNDRSVAKQRSGRTRKGSRWLNAALKDAVMAATRTKSTYLRALYERQRSRIAHAKAIGAVKHSMLVAVWHMLTNGQLYAVPRHRESSLLSLARIGTAWIASWVYSTVIKTTTSRRLPARSGPMRSPAGSGERDDPPEALPSCAECVSAPASLLRRG